jgi:hypothetical protein
LLKYGYELFCTFNACNSRGQIDSEDGMLSIAEETKIGLVWCSINCCDYGSAGLEKHTEESSYVKGK